MPVAVVPVTRTATIEKLYSTPARSVRERSVLSLANRAVSVPPAAQMILRVAVKVFVACGVISNELAAGPIHSTDDREIGLPGMPWSPSGLDPSRLQNGFGG